MATACDETGFRSVAAYRDPAVHADPAADSFPPVILDYSIHELLGEGGQGRLVLWTLCCMVNHSSMRLI